MSYQLNYFHIFYTILRKNPTPQNCNYTMKSLRPFQTITYSSQLPENFITHHITSYHCLPLLHFLIFYITWRQVAVVVLWYYHITSSMEHIYHKKGRNHAWQTEERIFILAAVYLP